VLTQLEGRVAKATAQHEADLRYCKEMKAALHEEARKLEGEREGLEEERRAFAVEAGRVVQLGLATQQKAAETAGLQVMCRWVTLRARWVTLRARWVTRRARWVTLRARWVTLRARWVTRRARWVTLKSSLGDAKSSLGDAKSSLGDTKELAG
jgi:hypothetical protein